MDGTVTVDRAKFREALDFVKNIIPLRPLSDADKNVEIVFSSKAKTITATASDGIQGAKAVVTDCAFEEGVEDFTCGVDPKKLVKIVTKDDSENLRLKSTDIHLIIYSAEAESTSVANEDFASLIKANMRKFQVMMSWGPKEPTTNVTLNTKFFLETLTFLDDFLPDGKDLGAKHAVVVLSNKVAHATNGVNLRGICASPQLAFTTNVSLRKRYLTNSIRALKNINCDKLIFLSNLQLISIASDDGLRTLVIPGIRKKPPVVPKDYLRPTTNYLALDLKATTKGIDRISSANYNTATTLTGVDLILSGVGEGSELKVVLDDDKATQTFPCSRVGGGEEDLEKTLDVKTFYKMLKMFQKSKEAKMEMGGEDSTFLRFIDKRTVDGVDGAFIAVCAYSRKV